MVLAHLSAKTKCAMVYHFTLACLLVKNSGAGKTKKHTVMLCNQNCKAKKNDSRIQETTVTRLTQKRLSTTIVQHLALNLSPGPTKKSPGICKPDTTLWYQPIRNICNGQIGSWNPKDPGWTFKKNNSWVATTQDTTRFFFFPWSKGTWSEYEYWNVPTRQHWSWSESTRAGPAVPCVLITERQKMIGVCNHLRNERYLGSITILRRWARIPKNVWSLGPFQFMGLVV